MRARHNEDTCYLWPTKVSKVYASLILPSRYTEMSVTGSFPNNDVYFKGAMLLDHSVFQMPYSKVKACFTEALRVLQLEPSAQMRPFQYTFPTSNRFAEDVADRWGKTQVVGNYDDVVFPSEGKENPRPRRCRLTADR